MNALSMWVFHSLWKPQQMTREKEVKEVTWPQHFSLLQHYNIYTWRRSALFECNSLVRLVILLCTGKPQTCCFGPRVGFSRLQFLLPILIQACVLRAISSILYCCYFQLILGHFKPFGASEIKILYSQPSHLYKLPQIWWIFIAKSN